MGRDFSADVCKCIRLNFQTLEFRGADGNKVFPKRVIDRFDREIGNILDIHQPGFSDTSGFPDGFERDLSLTSGLPRQRKSEGLILIRGVIQLERVQSISGRGF